MVRGKVKQNHSFIYIQFSNVSNDITFITNKNMSRIKNYDNNQHDKVVE